MAKKGPKMAVFGPPGPNLQKFSYFYPREAVYQISENLAHQNWKKCVTNKRRNGRTEGTEIIGPSGKIPGTNDMVKI